MKKLLQWIGNAIRSIVTDIHELIEINAPAAVKLTEKVKEAIEKHNGSIEWILDQTATEQDNKVYEFVQAKLPLILKEIAIIDGLVQSHHTTEEAFRIYSQWILSKQKEGRAKEWANIAAKILIAIVGRKFPTDLAIMATQRAFHILFGKK